MRGAFPGFSNSLLAIAMSMGMITASFVMTSTPAMAKKPKGPQASAGFIATAKASQDALAAVDKAKASGDAAATAAAVTAATGPVEASVAAVENDADKLYAGQFLLSLGQSKNDAAMNAKGLKMMLDSGQLGEELIPQYQFYLGNFAYASKDYATAAKALKAATDAGFDDDALGPILADSYAEAGMPREGIAAFKQAVTARRGAGKAIPESWFRRASLIAYNAKLAPEAIDVAALSVEGSQSNMAWLNAAQMTRTFGNLDVGATLDLFRLMDRTGALKTDAKFAAPEYKEYIEAADPRRLPGEVVRVVDEGVAAGVLSRSDTWVAEARQNAAGRIAADKASIKGEVAGAMAAGGIRALGLADAFLNYDDPVQAEALYKAALASGGADANVALTRLGIAQLEQGKVAEAKASFEKVTGVRQPLARLWLIHIANSTAGGAS